MSDPKPILNESEIRLLGQAWQCFKEGVSPVSNIDYERLAVLAGHTNHNSTRNRINAITKKLREANGGTSAPSSAPPTPGTPITPASAKPKGKAPKRKQLVTADGINIKGEHEDDNEPTTPIPKAKRARKETDKSGSATKATGRGDAKKVKKEETKDEDEDVKGGVDDVNGDSPPRGRSSRPRSLETAHSSGFTPLNGKGAKRSITGAMDAVKEEGHDTEADEDVV